jgi:hypothetical protein
MGNLTLAAVLASIAFVIPASAADLPAASSEFACLPTGAVA